LFTDVCIFATNSVFTASAAQYATVAGMTTANNSMVQWKYELILQYIFV